LTCWSFWVLAAPSVLSRGAHFTGTARRWRASLQLVLFGAAVIALRGAVVSQLTVWFQPFVPVESYTYTQAFGLHFHYGFAIDLVVYGMLLLGGGAFSAHQRARRLELRESRLEAELARAQLHALRLEIEPHFLFNTLNAIAALIRSQDNARALDVLLGLSTFMRNNLDDPREPFVPLSTEIEWVRRYVGLQQARFGERLEISYEIDADCLDVNVPTLMLQPIVENAFRHGVGKQAQHSRVVIGATGDNHRLTLWVADDGVGLRAGFDLSREAGTGLRNTRSRLEHTYGTAATLDIRGGEQAGTIVTIALPVMPARWEGKATA
jgi:two-component system LytT family sensor kinase